ncbi:MAG: hypothetical protein DHS20C15_26010 [Planctomycetota bacterium]|nr:MAG: hypothetical protein DHS20C15_26010 [Planctomycetota bacterium]
MRAHHDQALALAARLLGNHEDAEDALQEALIKTLRHLHRAEPDRGFRSWFLRIVFNQCLDTRRRRETRKRHEQASTPAPIASASVESRARGRESLARVRALMESMPPKQAAALHLRVFEEFDYEQIAGVLGITAGSARVYLVKARRRLRAELGEEWLP